MYRYAIRRLVSLVPVLAGVAFIVFTLLYMTPGDPARMALGDLATDEMTAEFREKEGLDDPFLAQFGRYLYNALRGDLGRSYMTKSSVFSELTASFPDTFKISACAIFIALVLGIPFGIVSAVKQYSIFDSLTMLFAMVGMSMPVFWLGLLLILTFSVHLRWLPSSGLDSLSALILPSATLATQSLAIITRMTRSSMLEVIRQDYIRTARAKGQKESVVILRHALRNALIPIVTVAGVQFGVLLGGAVLTESIFSIPGIGRLMVSSIKMRDYPVVQGGVLFIAFAASFVNLIVDLLYVAIDPRIKQG
ncbi:MAG: ABC transporter permease [Synergistaceae bacterium]|jgi:peptide/nickel transport system permease protein|nr:ABC transporter permease [Synergistaceae bacterium]